MRPRRLLLTIEPQDIDIRNVSDPLRCPVAQAMHRRFPGSDRIHANPDRVVVRSFEEGTTYYETSANLQNAIKRFDRKGIFKPGTYLLKAI